MCLSIIPFILHEVKYLSLDGGILTKIWLQVHLDFTYILMPLYLRVGLQAHPILKSLDILTVSPTYWPNHTKHVGQNIAWAAVLYQ